MATDEAIVLAGGFGTRLRSVVSDVPKPLAPVAGRPFLAWLLDRLAAAGMRHVVLATGYLADQVAAAMGGRWNDMLLDYSVETSPLGTGGALRAASHLLCGDAAHVLNGDTWLAYDMAEFERSTRQSAAELGMALARVDDVSRYGSVVLAAGRVQGFREKGQLGAGYINAGGYFLTARALAGLPDQAAYSFEERVLAPLVEAGRVAGYTDTSGFIDIGVPADYRRAQDLFDAKAPG